MQLDSQGSGIGPDRLAEDFENASSAAENRRELAFAVAAGDVESGHHGHGGDGSCTGPPLKRYECSWRGCGSQRQRSSWPWRGRKHGCRGGCPSERRRKFN